VLEYRNRKLAVVEAKAWDEALTEGVAQAKNYAGKLAVRFAYATNGQGIYQINMSPGQQRQSGQSCPPEREIAAFPTPEALWAMTFAGKGFGHDQLAEMQKIMAVSLSATPYGAKIGQSFSCVIWSVVSFQKSVQSSGQNRSQSF
jgi:type I site-specific restriction endonuclease